MLKLFSKLKKLVFWNSNSVQYHKASLWEIVVQALVLGLFALFLVVIINNYFYNINQRNIGVGFDFLDDTAGYQIGQSLIEYQENDTYLRVYFVGLLNTLLASFLAIIVSTIIGFAVGIFLLSGNLLLQKVSVGYIELLRNLPPLLHVLFWYIVVIQRVLPEYQDSLAFFDFVFLSVKGLTVPRLQWSENSLLYIIVTLAILSTMVYLGLYSRKRTLQGRPVSVWKWNLGFFLVFLILTFGMHPFDVQMPEMGKFRIEGGFTFYPELFAIVVALATYTSTYIATIVRSSILSIPKSQVEAAHSLGLNYYQRLRYIILPLALRSMIPPLTNQYLNITKNSSLGVAVGYPEIVAVFAGTALNQSGRAIEIMTMVMLTYLVISVFTSWLMNLYNKRITT